MWRIKYTVLALNVRRWVMERAESPRRRKPLGGLRALPRSRKVVAGLQTPSSAGVRCRNGSTHEAGSQSPDFCTPPVIGEQPLSTRECSRAKDDLHDRTGTNAIHRVIYNLQHLDQLIRPIKMQSITVTYINILQKKDINILEK